MDIWRGDVLVVQDTVYRVVTVGYLKIPLLPSVLEMMTRRAETRRTVKLADGRHVKTVAPLLDVRCSQPRWVEEFSDADESGWNCFIADTEQGKLLQLDLELIDAEGKS
jgi:hypothetical protein